MLLAYFQHRHSKSQFWMSPSSLLVLSLFFFFFTAVLFSFLLFPAFLAPSCSFLLFLLLLAPSCFFFFLFALSTLLNGLQQWYKWAGGFWEYMGFMVHASNTGKSYYAGVVALG